MNKAGRIITFDPPYAIQGGEILIECEGFTVGDFGKYGCFFNGQPARLVGASATRILAIVPDNLDSTAVEVYLESGGEKSEPKIVTIGKKLAEDLHMVANPAIDPSDDSIILTRSGSRGQQLPVTLLRYEKDGFLNEMAADILNPTGLAFDQSGLLFVTARADGEVCRITTNDEIVTYASNLGIATGIAFDRGGDMFVGDRSGTIYRVSTFGDSETFASMEPSVSAYHMAFGTDDKLYVTAPGLSSFDSVHKIDRSGNETLFYRGLGRPQGLAFSREGDLYVAACIQGRHGIVKISSDGKNAKLFVAGYNAVGLCFNRNGDMVIATNEAVFSVPVGIEGNLLD